MISAQSFDTAEVYSPMALEAQSPESHGVEIWVLVWLGSSGRMRGRQSGFDHHLFQLMVDVAISWACELSFSKPAAYHCFSESASLSFYHMAIAFFL